MNKMIENNIINARGASVQRLLADVEMTTSMGEITLELFPDKAPNTVANFTQLAREGFYDGTKFHRVIEGFMIQGGDPLSKGNDVDRYGTGGPGYTFADEIYPAKFVEGTLAMANAGPNTNGSQFFILTAKTRPSLEGKYTIFGRVIRGMDVVHAIERVPTNENDLPLTPIFLERIALKH
ncbi:MAG: hypothetical protein A2542_01025 [Parcubacteria group bacterium RIFOXYD2_FULL_52_8]|nr:MAG: hypothetical protein A2542_01025 [Parcubacteria group bacterium RIFOXYD2_FULL_52_8]